MAFGDDFTVVWIYWYVRAENQSCRVLASRFGVSASTISRIKRGRDIRLSTLKRMRDTAYQKYNASETH